jgi:hypothetical protein
MDERGASANLAHLQQRNEGLATHSIHWVLAGF